MAQRQWRAGPINIRVTTPEPAKEPLSRDRIVAAALAQMAKDGYDAVSMRSIARELGTGPASLYAHVPNKDTLDQLVMDRIASQLEIPEPDPERWQEQVRELLIGMLALYRAHPGSARAAVATIPTMEGGLGVAEGMMSILLAGGVDPQAAAWFLDLSALYISAIGAEESIWEDRRRADSRDGVEKTHEELVAEIHEVFASLPPAMFPTLSAHAASLNSGDGNDRLEFGLDVLLAGLDAVSKRMKAKRA